MGGLISVAGFVGYFSQTQASYSMQTSRSWAGVIIVGLLLLLSPLFATEIAKQVRQHVIWKNSDRASMKSTLESQATAFIDRKDEAGKRISDPIGKGLLVLRDDDKVAFVKKKLLGGYQQEPSHAYYISRIVNLKKYSDGLDVEVYYPATEEEPAEVITVFYELKDDANRWYETLQRMRMKKEPEPATSQTTLTPQPVTREIIKEKEIITREIWFRCPHCHEKYEEGHSRCPHCGAPA